MPQSLAPSPPVARGRSIREGDTILPWLRNAGESLGLEWPLIMGFVGRPRRWAIWDRHTGRIVHVEPRSEYLDEDRDILARAACSRKCREMNGIVETRESRALVNALHDMEA